MRLLSLVFAMAILVLPAQSPAAPVCNPALAKSVIARIDQVQTTSTACRKIMASNAPKATICSVCRATHTRLSSLRADYKANKTCLKSNPAVRAKALTYFSFRSSIKRLRKLCG
jgi:hypothetical protein